jgi:hypothetical protein
VAQAVPNTDYVPPFPFTVVQEAQGGGGGQASSFTITFPKATAASGNTAFLLLASGNQTETMPTGWTVDLDVTATSYSRFTLLHKATASDTGFTLSATSGMTVAYYFFELSGTHALDASSTGTSADALSVFTPAITPTAGSLVFGAMAGVLNAPPILVSSYVFGTGNVLPSQSMDPTWQPFGSVAATTGSPRYLQGFVRKQSATNTSTTPPVINVTQNGAQLTSAGVAYVTFSIL